MIFFEKCYYLPSQSICSKHLLHPKKQELHNKHVFDNPVHIH